MADLRKASADMNSKILGGSDMAAQYAEREVLSMLTLSLSLTLTLTLTLTLALTLTLTLTQSQILTSGCCRWSSSGSSRRSGRRP